MGLGLKLADIMVVVVPADVRDDEAVVDEVAVVLVVVVVIGGVMVLTAPVLLADGAVV